MRPLKADKDELQMPKNRKARVARPGMCCPFCKKDIDAKQIQRFAASLAGAAGTGLSKTRSKSHYRRIAKVRWDKLKSVSSLKNIAVSK